MRAFHESPGRIYTDLTCINLKAHITKSCMFLVFEASLTNSVDPDQIALVGAV